MPKNIKGWICVKDKDSISDLIEQYNFKVINHKNIFLHLTGTKENFIKFEKENPRYIMNFEKNT